MCQEIFLEDSQIKGCIYFCTPTKCSESSCRSSFRVSPPRGAAAPWFPGPAPSSTASSHRPPTLGRPLSGTRTTGKRACPSPRRRPRRRPLSGTSVNDADVGRGDCLLAIILQSDCVMRFCFLSTLHFCAFIKHVNRPWMCTNCTCVFYVVLSGVPSPSAFITRVPWLLIRPPTGESAAQHGRSPWLARSPHRRGTPRSPGPVRVWPGREDWVLRAAPRLPSERRPANSQWP